MESVAPAVDMSREISLLVDLKLGGKKSDSQLLIFLIVIFLKKSR